MRLILILQEDEFEAYGILFPAQGGGADLADSGFKPGRLDNFLVKDQSSEFDQLLLKAIECTASQNNYTKLMIDSREVRKDLAADMGYIPDSSNQHIMSKEITAGSKKAEKRNM